MLAAVASLPASAGPAHAGTVADWNLHATDALIVAAGQSPTVSLPHLAMVHGAVYDAVNAIDRRFDPYLRAPAAERWYSAEAAATAAAHRVLSALVPAQQAALDARRRETLARIPAGAARDGGIAAGSAAADAMIAARAADGRFGAPGFPVSLDVGRWRPGLPAFVNDPAAWIGRVRPFLLERASQFRSRGPDPLGSSAYARDFAEVKALGAATGSARTPQQTEVALFWAEHPTAMWSRVFRRLAAAKRLGVAGEARLFAMLDLTGADAVIACWDDKAHWRSWRPITAIREAAADGNAATSPDPGWLPLVPTPPYPEHPAGHGCLSGAIVRTLQDVFGDATPFSAQNVTLGATRSFTRFSQAIREVIDARVFSGIHFRTADLQGELIGRQVARWRAEEFFEPDDDDE